MRYWIFLCLVLSTRLNAYETTLKVDDFAVVYADDEGRGRTAGIQIDAWSKPAFEFDLMKEGEEFVLKTSDNEYRTNQFPAFLLDVSKFNIQRLFFHNHLKDYRLRFNWFSYSTSKEEALFDTANLHCVRSDTPTDYTDAERLLEACLTQSDVSISRIRTTVYESSDFALERVLALSMGAFNAASTTTIEGLRIQIRNHQVVVKMRLKSFVSANIEIKGQALYEKSKLRVSFRIDRAKAGWFDIRSRLFAEFSKDKTGFVTVKKPYVYFNF